MNYTSAPPSVSVIVANYNGAPFIEAALRSALMQTLTSLEVIVADDGSTDESPALVATMAALDPRLRLLPAAPNGGPAAARNRCLDAARGTWIAVLDSDDLMHPQRLKTLIDAAEADAADIALDDLLLFDADLLRPPVPCLHGADAAGPRWIDLPGYISANTMFRRRAALGYLKPLIRAATLAARCTRYDTGLRIGEDYDLIARLLNDGARMRLYPEPTYFYRRHPASISHRLAGPEIHALLAANARFAAVARADAQPQLQERGAMLERALAFDALVGALKQRRWPAAIGLGLANPQAALLLRQPIGAALARLRPRRAKRRPPGKHAVILSRNRLLGGTSGSSRYLLDLIGTIADCGVKPHLVVDTPASFGRSPLLRLGPEMDLFATIRVRGGVRLGHWLIALHPAVWGRGLRGAAGVLLARCGLDAAALNQTAPYAIAVPWTRRDRLFVARHARSHGDLIVADYAFLAPGIAYVLRPEATSLVVMHDLFSSRAAQFDRLGAADSVARIGTEAEMALLGLADTVIAIQPEEAGTVQAALPLRQVLVAPIAVRPVAAAQPGTDEEVLFVGTSAAPNVVGLRRFLDEAWPLIRAARPAARLAIGGAVGAAVGPLPAGATALGFVPALAPLYRRAAVVIAPLPAGSGLKIKLVEALGHGKAVVASSSALQGVAAEAVASVWQADSAAETAAAVIELLSNPELRTRYATAALRAAASCYGADRCHRDLRARVCQSLGLVPPSNAAFTGPDDRGVRLSTADAMLEARP